MRKKIRLSNVIFKKVEKINKDEMKDLKGAESIEAQYCQLLCEACGDSIAELIYMLPDTDTDVPPCNN